MLIDRVVNPWIRFKVLFTTLQEKEKGQASKDVFLYIIANESAFNFQKLRVLDNIASIHPLVTKIVCDEELLKHFQHLCNESEKRSEIVSPKELDWVNKYVLDIEIRVKIEKLIYRRLLVVSSYWDKMRRNFDWSISKNDRLELAREVLLSKHLGSKRKMELAKELGEPYGDFKNAYYKKLLYDKHYDKAETLGVNNPDLVIEVIISNVNMEYFRVALNLVQRFIPDREDIAMEIKQIKSALCLHG